MKKRRRFSRRVAPYHVQGPCDCLVCAEKEQLSIAARWAPDLSARIVAMNLLGAMAAVDAGVMGYFDLGDCFD